MLAGDGQPGGGVKYGPKRPEIADSPENVTAPGEPGWAASN
jgi:hypothetical protein